ncbi:MAG: caiB [Ilumatobacteraceae bacterium]|nr:caiB [Ilumatobacteraceae bacterium]
MHTATAFLAELTMAIGGGDAAAAPVTFTGEHPWPSAFAVTDFAAASIAAAAGEAAALAVDLGGSAGEIVVDRDLASLWFAFSLVPEGWQLPAVWDAVAGDYLAGDGWIRLHTNAPHHRRAALAVLGIDDRPDLARADVEPAVAVWAGDELEAAVVEAGGCAAAMRTNAAWAGHPQGVAVAGEALIAWHGTTSDGPTRPTASTSARPLAGVRVLDLTRVLAGPVATRFLAGLGADVLRIDPPDWDEAAVVPEVTLGKRCGRLDLRDPAGLDALRRLLAEADIVVHGYRPGALDGLGLGADDRAEISPGLIDISLDAYGWSGPWADRRGFDSLVQMSCGIAAAGMAARGADRPVPLPVQALDHATGYLLAAAALRGWRDRLHDGHGRQATASLARTAATLIAGPAGSFDEPGPSYDDAPTTPERTPWGGARRLQFAATIDGTPFSWDRPAGPLGSESSPLRWLDDR